MRGHCPEGLAGQPLGWLAEAPRGLARGRGQGYLSRLLWALVTTPAWDQLLSLSRECLKQTRPWASPSAGLPAAPDPRT